ncbi:MAG TPA: TolC family protein [Gemmatimonadaceae bacterium]|nr:TolC family protein [Gemmatimonadaceae bacterium]
MRSSVVAAAMLGIAALAPVRAVRAQVADSTLHVPVRDSSLETTPQSVGTGPELTLDEAIATAVRNNPAHLQVVETSRTANAQKRAAYGALVPRIDASLTAGYLAAGSSIVSGVSLGAGADLAQSNYVLAATYTLNAPTLINPKLQSANVEAVEADISSSSTSLRNVIAQNYITVLADEAKARLQDTLIINAQSQLELAKAKLAVGSGTTLDVTRAEVNLGTQQVAAIRARNAVDVDRLILFENMGVPAKPDVRLTTRFPVAQPSFTLDSMLNLAAAGNPALAALRARDRAADYSVKSAKGQFLPTLQVSTGWSGYTNSYTDVGYPIGIAQQAASAGLAACLSVDTIRVRTGLPSANCNSNPAFNVTSQDSANIRAANSKFPFGFASNPFQIAATISLPIFNNLSRELQVEQAIATRNDADYALKAQQLKTTADVTGAYLTLVAAAQAVDLQRKNSAAALLALQLAEARYRVGAATFLDLQDARTQFETAENDRINAIFAYHQAFAALESAVGRPLR